MPAVRGRMGGLRSDFRLFIDKPRATQLFIGTHLQRVTAAHPLSLKEYLSCHFQSYFGLVLLL